MERTHKRRPLSQVPTLFHFILFKFNCLLPSLVLNHSLVNVNTFLGLTNTSTIAVLDIDHSDASLTIVYSAMSFSKQLL